MLTSVLSAAEIDGIQGQGVIACAKHFIDNNQEGPGHNGRLVTNVNIEPRAQRELYYKAFQGAIGAGVGSIMCSCKDLDTLFTVHPHLSLAHVGIRTASWILQRSHPPPTAPTHHQCQRNGWLTRLRFPVVALAPAQTTSSMERTSSNAVPQS